MEQPIAEIAETAVDALRMPIAKPERPLPSFVFRAKLCRRASTGGRPEITGAPAVAGAPWLSTRGVSRPLLYDR
jgi:hypothetical protein